MHSVLNPDLLSRRALPRVISCIHRLSRNFWRKESLSRRRSSVIGNLPRTSPSSGTIPWSREMDPSSHRYVACIVRVFSLFPDTVVFLVAGVCFRRDRARLVRGDQRLSTLHGVGRVPRCSAKCRSNHSTGSEEWATRHQR